jgi:glyoxylase-like metal-dependent hydrolase (beta-lactamase superfamily II)
VAECRVDEVADGVYRISTYLPDVVVSPGLTINQFLVLADEPLLHHTGLRTTFPDTVAAVDRLVPVERLRWLSFGHVETDRRGADESLPGSGAAARSGLRRALGCRVSLQDIADRPPRSMAPGEAIDLGGRRVVVVPTPHAPHNLEAQVLYEESTRTVLCGDLFTQLGPGPAVTTDSLTEAALHAEDVLRSAPPRDAVPRALEHLADLEPRTLAVMHGSSFEGDGGVGLRELARAWPAHPSAPAKEMVTAGRLGHCPRAGDLSPSAARAARPSRPASPASGQDQRRVRCLTEGKQRHPQTYRRVPGRPRTPALGP